MVSTVKLGEKFGDAILRHAEGFFFARAARLLAALAAFALSPGGTLAPKLAFDVLFDTICAHP